MSNTKRNQLIHALLAIQPLLVDESARYSLNDLKEMSDKYLVFLAANFICLYDEYVASKLKAKENITNYSKLKKHIEWLNLLIS